MQDHRLIAGLIAAPLALLLTAGAAHAQTDPAATIRPPMAQPAPVALFKTVCLDGAARLSKKWAVATVYPAIPAAAKAALGHADADVPNPVFQIGGGNQYLILPAPDSGPSFADGCAVVWQGDALAEANTVLAFAQPEQIVTATLTKGWTVLKALPRPPAPEPTPAGVR